MTPDEFVAKWPAVDAAYQLAVAQYVTEMVQAQFPPGGECYDQLLEGALSSAESVYDGYAPLVYDRRWSLIQDSNIQIQLMNLVVKNGSGSGSVRVANIATGEEGGLLEPKIMSGWSRPAFYWGSGPKEPWSIAGRDLYASVPSAIDVDIVLPQEIADQFFAQALLSIR